MKLIKHVGIFLPAFIFLLASCSPTIHTQVKQSFPALHSNEDVKLFGLSETVPDGTQVIGSVKIGDSGFTTDCSWNTVVEKARMEARKIGGNGIKITAHLLPSPLGSSCHRITADILKLSIVTDSVYPNPHVSPGSADTLVSPLSVAPERDRLPYHADRLLKPKSNFRMEVYGGFSYLTATTSSSLPPFLKSYVDELKSGTHWGASITGFFNPNFGAGVRYSNFNTNNKLDGQIVVTNQSTGQSRVGNVSDDITLNFIGPEFCGRVYSNNNKFCFLMSIAIGYADYKNNSEFVDKFTITGNTLAYGMNAGVDYVFDQNIGAGISIRTLAGALSSVNVNDGATNRKVTFPSGEEESISRVDLSAGLRFYF